jgi:hypothetical protein
MDDESYILSSHIQQKSWSDNSLNGLLTPVSKVRLIMIHAGGENGFVPNALEMWKSQQAAGDYQHNKNQANYEKWVKDKLTPNLPAEGVFVTDNMSYHNVKK